MFGAPFFHFMLKFSGKKKMFHSASLYSTLTPVAQSTPYFVYYCSLQGNSMNTQRGSDSTRQERKYAGKVLREVDIEHIQINTMHDYFVGNTVSRVSQGLQQNNGEALNKTTGKKAIKI